MKIMSLFTRPGNEATETVDAMKAMADRLTPKKLPACVATVDDAQRLRSELGRLLDDRPAIGALSKALRDRIAVLDDLLAALRFAMKLRAAAAHLVEDRVTRAKESDRAAAQLEQAEREVRDVDVQLLRLDTRLNALVAEHEASQAAAGAEVSAVEAQLRAAIQAGDEKAELAASEELGRVTARRADDLGLRARLDQTRLARAELQAQRDAREAERVAAKRKRCVAACEVAAVDADAAANRLSLVVLDLVVQRREAAAAGLDNASWQYGTNTITLRVMSAQRAWFTAESDGGKTTDVAVTGPLQRLAHLLANPLPPLGELASPLPDLPALSNALAAA